ncbi:MAG: GDP-mannose 4,6-dehydratase [Methylovirgula sp.]
MVGVNGQDGSYLAEVLLRRGHEVIGCGRDENSRYVRPRPSFIYEKMDICDLAAFAMLVRHYEPNVAFHVAAVHGPAGFEYEQAWREMMTVNVLSLHVLLEHARVRAPSMRVVYAGSSKIFPLPLSGEIDERTPASASCLYSIGKLASRNLILQYHDKHRVSATNAILFNHESIRRSESYFIPRIAKAIVAAKADRSYFTTVQTLDFRADWGDAEEFMDIMADIALNSDVPEVILASGTTWHARSAVRLLFARHGLDFRDHIGEVLPPRDPGPEFHVDVGQLSGFAGRRPLQQLTQLVDRMVDALQA